MFALVVVLLRSRQGFVAFDFHQYGGRGVFVFVLQMHSLHVTVQGVHRKGFGRGKVGGE